MNIQLLEEIEELRSQEIPDSDIASMLGITKANLLLMLRVKKVVEDSVSKKTDDLLKENETLHNELTALKAKLPKIDNIDVIIEQNRKIPLLKDEITNLEDHIDDLNFKYSVLEDKYRRVPNFIKRIFCE